MKLLVAAALLGLASAQPNCPPSNMDWSCCSPSNKCAAGGGDCDTDSDCLSGNCVSNVGFLYGTHWQMDVCDPYAPDMCYEDFNNNNDIPGTNPSEISGPWRERARAVVKLTKAGGGGVCTAFKYSADLYAANAHCEEYGTMDRIIFDHECWPGQDLDTCVGNQSKTCSVKYIDGSAYPPYNSSEDWAIYRLDGFCIHNIGRNWLHIAPLQSASSLNGQKIVVIHHPAGHRKIIHGLTNISPGTQNASNSPLDCSVLSATVEPGVIRTQCIRGGVQKVVPTAGGSSGSPIFNTAGQVITINNGSYGCGRFHSMSQDNVHSTFYPMYPQTDECYVPMHPNCSVGRRPEVDESMQAPGKRPEEEEADTGNQGSLQAPMKRVEIPL